MPLSLLEIFSEVAWPDLKISDKDALEIIQHYVKDAARHTANVRLEDGVVFSVDPVDSVDVIKRKHRQAKQRKQDRDLEKQGVILSGRRRSRDDRRHAIHEESPGRRSSDHSIPLLLLVEPVPESSP